MKEIKKTVKAKKFLELIAYSAHTMGDPGIMFIDNMNEYHLLSEYEDVKFTATNPRNVKVYFTNGTAWWQGRLYTT